MEQRKYDEIYANCIEMTVSPYDFSIVFGADRLNEDSGKTENVNLVKVRISPQLAKTLCSMLNSQIGQYESKIGTICIPLTEEDSKEK